jgi:hypothetical protein
MKQTAMQELIIILEGIAMDDELTASFKCGITLARYEAQELLKKEKEQIINSHVKCLMIGIQKEGKTKFTDEDKKLVKQDIENYFDETFKK